MKQKIEDEDEFNTKIKYNQIKLQNLLIMGKEKTSHRKTR
jgi:hypothetical protein